MTGIVPKMAIRFSSFEFYKTFAPIDPITGKISSKAVFFCELHRMGSVESKLVLINWFTAGLLAGATEAVAVVTPMEGKPFSSVSPEHETYRCYSIQL